VGAGDIKATAEVFVEAAMAWPRWRVGESAAIGSRLRRNRNDGGSWRRKATSRPRLLQHEAVRLMARGYQALVMTRWRGQKC